ncbi:LuxR C-terminal-related transcriptional regulator [Flavobacteriaceae bacterium F89]|uniref:LuxR C-terminal-related transcriptional regulator n=1 Tax=Cerina litoralis TaxID=2874477 RepID=A0AAE3JPX7_9FLAO|nr:LuxR C-terminal-related transcriptional regulator [Cerina litoralis]MCG2461506.1 LuxR C-terminal-related transcriptional regulator [Cerina litoralis]
MQKIENWTRTYTQLYKADREHTLEPKELETYALAAYLIGRDAESFKILDRAHQGYLNRKKTEQAVRCAFWLGLMFINTGEMARGSGWIARGERLIKDGKGADCAEKGLLLLPAALGTLSAGHAAKARTLFEQAVTIGEQFGDVDLIALGRLGNGQALIQLGDVAKGIKLLDETMVAVETEEVFPIACGVIYCAVIETCRKVWDLGRAQEWTSALTRWCDAQPDIIPFRGQCLVRRAEIIQFHGEWHKALEEIGSACKLLTRPPGEPAAGEAFYCKAELFRLLGNFEGAEDCYREASKWGRNPQPGLALLRLAQGQVDAAETAIRNTLKETKDNRKRAELLPAAVRIMIAVKRNEEALDATKELDNIVAEFDAPYLYAMSSHCRGAVFLTEGSVQLALDHLQKALKIWNTLHLPYESAHTKELIGLVYSKMDDKDNSDLALAAAKWVYEQLKARPDLQRINRLLNQQRNHEAFGLTLRELQVLRRVASGKTNKSVAGDLFISERTVDRHVSNIFNKLGVSSRVEATTFALRNKILDNAL